MLLLPLSCGPFDDKEAAGRAKERDTLSRRSSSLSTANTMSAIARSQRIKAEAFLAEAEKTLKKTTWFASSAEAKHEQAAELYEKAANAFKVGQFFMEAGQAYVKASEIHRDKLNSLGEASKSLSNAGKKTRYGVLSTRV